MDSDMEEIKNANPVRGTKNCKSCAVECDNGVCLLEELITTEVLLIKEVRDKFCSKKISFGNSYICSCQAREDYYYSTKKEKTPFNSNNE